jgi:glutamine---fructose-6-phosphate transaminase (isomerizing)
MSGIVGYVGAQQATPILLESLQRLAYRGYESAGIAVLNREEKLVVRKSLGKLADFVKVIRDGSPDGSLGIGHTGWFTHGRPNDDNAHPHCDCHNEIAVVHDGIIENYTELRMELCNQGHLLRSETDTEVLPHLIEMYYSMTNGDFLKAVSLALSRINGSYSIAVISSHLPGTLIGARRFSPMVVGWGEHEQFLASDVSTLLKYIHRVLVLEDGEIAVLSPDCVRIFDLAGSAIARESIVIEQEHESVEKGNFDHFMLKEIYEEPDAIRRSLSQRLIGLSSDLELHLSELTQLEGQGALQRIQRVVIVGCGTPLNAGLIAKYMLEEWARIPVEVVIASEFRCSNPVLGPEVLCIPITQSGETADTLAAARHARVGGALIVSLTNVVASAIARLSDAVLYLHAGPEISVLSTKAFVSEVVVLALLALHLGRSRGTLKTSELELALKSLQRLPEEVQWILDHANDGQEAIAAVARELSAYQSIMFIGRGVGYPVALEAAMKLKEVAYIHGEGFAGGEFKHGPIALLCPDMPVIAIVTAGRTYGKIMSNIRQIHARDARIVAVVTKGDTDIQNLVQNAFYIPPTHELLAPILQIIPLQLFAYHAALARGCNIDQPRNLAKSLTVE